MPATDSLLLATLLPAMASSETLDIPGGVSPKLLKAVPKIQEIFFTWDRLFWTHKYPARPRLRPVTVKAGSREPWAPKEKVASFFSAGVDSFYTALKHSDEIDALVYVHGFDVKPDRPELRRKVIEGVQSSAAGLGKTLIEVEVDLASLSPDIVPWGVYHGAALAAVAALLSTEFGKMYVPSSFCYSQLGPWGSHALLDPLWSTDEMEIENDGGEWTRNEKIVILAENKVAQRWLRVCLDNPGDSYNCSSCEKCLRTMVFLRAIGALGSFTSFPLLDAAHMRFAFRPRLPGYAWRRAWRETLSTLSKSGHDPDLEKGIQRVLETKGGWSQDARHD